MKKKKVIELIRVSTEAQAGSDRASIAAQRAVNRNTAAQYGLEIIDTVELSDVSGTAVLRAPEIQRLLTRLESKEVDGVVCREFSRLIRPDRIADWTLLAVFQDYKKTLYLPGGPVDFSTRQGMLLGGVQALMAGHERSEMLERSWTAKEAMRRQGKSPNGSSCLPYGVLYDRATGKWSYDPEKAPQIRKVFRRFLAGDTNYNALSEPLGMTHGGAKYTLTNPIYMGWPVVDEKRDLSSDGKREGKDGRQAGRRTIPRSEAEVIRVRVIDPPLVSETDFARVQQLVRAKATARLRQRRHVGEFVYNGFLRCSQCGARLHAYRNGHDRHYYICSNRKRKNEAGEMLCSNKHYMERDKLEKLLDGLLSQKLRDLRLLKAVAREQVRRYQARSTKQRVRQLEEQLSALQARRERVVEAFLDGALKKDDRDRRLAAIDQTIATATAELAEQKPSPTFDPDSLAALFAPFRGWVLLSRDEKRRMLNAIAPEFRAVALGRGEYEVTELRLLGVPVGISVASPLAAPPC